MHRSEGQPVRALVTFNFSVDQVISGVLMANGQRFPFTRAELNPETWTVSINAEGQDRSGNTLNYMINAKFEKLDSPTERTLAGTWQEGINSGEFRIVIN